MSSGDFPAASPRGRSRRSKTSVGAGSERTSFVGRDEDLRELRATLGRARLVTLLGPGGVGKSRLARELVIRVESKFPGGVWLVELAEVGNASRVAPAVARALGVFEHVGKPLDELIAGALQSPALLILDNCEHVIEASAELSATLLGASPSLRILATSREPLELTGERIFAVSALPVPGAPEDVTLSDYASFPGLQLFVDRVLSRDRTFRVTSDNLPLIASVCARVGGMPLALELAAGRASRVTLSTLTDQIDEQLGFETLLPEVPERHRSMRAALAASYDPLPPHEQELWKRLSTFRGGATLAATREVCAYGGLEGDGLARALDGLLEHSIVSLDSTTPDGRYRMLEPIRLFGLERARESGEERSLRRAHLEWCASLIPTDAWLAGSEQLRWTRTFQTEHSNIATALDHSLREGDVSAGLELFAGTFFFWGLSGWYREEHHYAQALLAASTTPSKTRTLVLFGAGLATWFQWKVAQRWFEETQAAASRDPRGQGLAQFGLGYCAIMSEAYDRAITLLESSCDLLAESESTVFLVYARYALSQAYALGRHDYVTARELVESSLALAAPDDILNHGITRAQLGLLDWRVGALDDAEAHLLDALELQTTLGHRWGLGVSLECLAWVAVSRHEYTRAAQLLGYADRLFERIGKGFFPGLAADHDHAVELVRKRLGPKQSRALSRAGARMEAHEILSVARRDTTTGDEGGAELLTERELEVAELVADGATNVQISSELLIAHETVKTHVRSILRKLGFESRVQIAAWHRDHDRGARTS